MSSGGASSSASSYDIWNKRPSTDDLQNRVNDLSKRVKLQERELKRIQFELVDAKKEYDKKKKFDTFMETMTTGTCVICSNNFYDCIGESGMAFATYNCRCSKQQVVHLGCWTTGFRCACGTHARLQVENHDGSEVKVTIEKIENDDVDISDDDDSDGDFLLG